MIFFTMNPNLKIFFGGEGEGGLGERARVSEFFTKHPNLKEKNWGGGGGGGGEWGLGVGRWTDRRTGPNQSAP